MTDIFQLKSYKFPDGFIFGSSTAGHQIEGNNINSANYYSELERKSKDPDYDISGMACNNYELFKEDIKMMRDLGHKAFRMTIEWPRIQPTQDTFDEEAVEHYIEELKLLNESGIQVFLTLVHCTAPKWFADLGGFNKIENFCYFEIYLDYLLPKISSYVSYYNTFNETNHPNISSEQKLCYLKYHAKCYALIRKYSDAPVSMAHSLHLYMPKRPRDKFDVTMTEYYDNFVNEYFFHAIRTGEAVLPGIEAEFVPGLKDSCDFWAIQWYTRDMIDARQPNQHIVGKYRHRHMDLIDMKFYFDEIYAEGMLAGIMRLRDKPVIITENGCSADDDRFRIVWIAEVLSSLSEAIDLGVDVRGYLYWSLMDNWEWGSFKPRFGLVECNFETFERKPRPSAYFYKEIIENNGFDQKILRKYLNEAPTVKR